MQEAIVAVAVAWSAWVVARRCAPKALRQAAHRRLLVAMRMLGWNRLADRSQWAEQASATGCAACGSCGTCGTGGGSNGSSGGGSNAGADRPGVRGSITPDALRRTAKR